MKEFLLKLFAGSIEGWAESKLEEVLQKLHDSNPEAYKATIYGGLALVKGIGPLVKETSTNIDDMVVESLEFALKKSAADNGITILENPTISTNEATDPPGEHGGGPA